MRSVAGDHLARRLVIEAKGRNAAVLAVKHSRLAVRSSGRQPAEPAAQGEPFTHQLRYRRTKPELKGPPQIRIGESVDLQHDQPSLRRPRPFLARERAVLGAIVPPEKRSGSRASAALGYSRRRFIWRNSSPIGTGLSKTSAQPASMHCRRDSESLWPVIARVARGETPFSLRVSSSCRPLPSGSEISRSMRSGACDVPRSTASATVAAVS